VWGCLSPLVHGMQMQTEAQQAARRTALATHVPPPMYCLAAVPPAGGMPSRRRYFTLFALKGWLPLARSMHISRHTVPSWWQVGGWLTGWVGSSGGCDGNDLTSRRGVVRVVEMVGGCYNGSAV
jgi:hypothetical protein